MTIFDITDTAFVDDLTVEESNDWMHQNVGELQHASYELSEGDGWKIFWEPEKRRWLTSIEEDSKAMLFALRWL